MSPGRPALAGLLLSCAAVSATAQFVFPGHVHGPHCVHGPRLGQLLGQNFVAPPPRLAEASPLGLAHVTTADVQLIYPSPLLSYLVPHTLATFQQSLQWQQRVFGWRPSDRIGLVLNDFSDYGNATATPLPRNTLRLDIEPTSNAFETNPGSERMASTMNHELVHLATTDIANSDDRFWRRAFFGKVPITPQHPESLLYSWLTVPRFTVPRWLLEGSAVFMETWMNGGLGRAQGGWDEMVFRAMVRDAAPFYDALGLVSRGTRVDFQVGANAYLYGTRFITWLAHEHGPEKVVAWLKRDEGSARHYATQYAQVFGHSLDEGWRRWIAFERRFQQDNLAQVRQQPITALQPLLGRALGSVSRSFVDESRGELLAAVRYPGVVEHIAALDMKSGTMRRLTDLRGAPLYAVTSLAFDPGSRTLFYTQDNLAWRDLLALDLATGQTRELMKDERIGELVFNRSDGSLLGVRHHSGLATLVQIAPPYTGWRTLHTFAYGTVPSDLDVSPDGTLLSASIAEPNGEQFLRLWKLADVLAGRMTVHGEFRFGQSAPEGFVFSRDGRHLYGSAYYTGVSNIFRYEVGSGDVQAVSNAETGLFRPLPLADGRLLVYSFSGQGFQPAAIDPRPLKDLSAIRFLGNELARRHALVTTWQVPPASAAVPAPVLAQGDFDPKRALVLQNAYPVLQGYRDSVGLGWRAAFGDPLGYASLSAMAAVTPGDSVPANERLHVVLRGHYLNWRASLAWNTSDFYDLFGPTKRSRKGLAARIGVTRSLIFETPRLADLLLDLAYFDRIATLPDAQNVGTTFTRQFSAEATLRYSELRRSLGAIDDEKGIFASSTLALHRTGGGFSDTVWQLRGQLDLGTPLPLQHSSLWSRSAVGAAGGQLNNPLASFYFGGFGNNKVDEGSVKRYREFYAMPGFELNALAGRRFAKQMVEWNLPPWVFESLGRPDFHLQSLRPALFATALWTKPGGGATQRHHNLGAQVDLRLSVLHWYEATLSAGVARGRSAGKASDTEWMLSLKLF